MNRNHGKEERISYAVVNGQTGKITAELPVDFKKYLLGSLFLAVLIFAVLNFISTPTPGRMLMYAGILAAAGLFISNAQMNRIWRREKRSDDIGLSTVRTAEEPGGAAAWSCGQSEWKNGKYLELNLALGKVCLIGIVAIIMTSVPILPVSFIISGSLMYVFFILFILLSLFSYLLRKKYLPGRIRIKMKEKKEKVPFGRKLTATWKQLAALGVIAAIIIARPVSDYYYYGAALAALLLTAWSFYNIVEEYNQLTTRPVPQLGKRGCGRDE